MNNYVFPLGGEAAPQRRMGDSLTDAARLPFAAGYGRDLSRPLLTHRRCARHTRAVRACPAPTTQYK